MLVLVHVPLAFREHLGRLLEVAVDGLPAAPLRPVEVGDLVPAAVGRVAVVDAGVALLRDLRAPRWGLRLILHQDLPPVAGPGAFTRCRGICWKPNSRRSRREVKPREPAVELAAVIEHPPRPGAPGSRGDRSCRVLLEPALRQPEIVGRLAPASSTATPHAPAVGDELGGARCDRLDASSGDRVSASGSLTPPPRVLARPIGGRRRPFPPRTR